MADFKGFLKCSSYKVLRPAITYNQGCQIPELSVTATEENKNERLTPSKRASFEAHFPPKLQRAWTKETVHLKVKTPQCKHSL